MRAIVTILALLLSADGLAAAEPLQAERGLIAHVDIEYQPPLRASASQSPTSPIMVRVFDTETPNHQRVEFIGAVAGAFDLRDFLEREDGRAIGDDLPELPVVILSRLPANHTTDLYTNGETRLAWRVHYQEFLLVAAAIWIAVPVAALVVRVVRRRPRELSAETTPDPTPADQIRALLDAARGRPLSIDERGRLELLVLRLLTDDTTATDASAVARAIHELREDPRTRDLVTAVERWLHARDSGPEARRQASLALERFRLDRLSESADGRSRSEVGA